MPVHIRAYIVVLVLSLAMLPLMRYFVSRQAIGPVDYRLRASVWIVLTSMLYLTHSYWVFAGLAILILFLASKKDSRPFSFYCFLLFVVPPFPVPLPGLGLFKSVFELDHFRMLSLCVLLPIWVRMIGSSASQGFLSNWTDRLVFGYIALSVALLLPHVSLTSILRAAVWMFLDVFLPYFVASRALQSLEDVRDAIASLIVAVALMAPQAVFEFTNHWLLYNSISDVVGAGFWGFNNYLPRGDAILRASVTTGHPIVLGLLFAVALGLAIPLQEGLGSGRREWRGMLLSLAAGLVVAMSRGPWVGAAAMLLTLILTAPHLKASIGKFLLVMLFLSPLLFTDNGQKVIDYLPFVGSVESENVEFRQRLFDVSMTVFFQNPWLGAVNYISNPQMEQMRGNDGIIDMVNCYVAVALGSGVVGLLLFVAPYALSLFGLAKLSIGARSRPTATSSCARALIGGSTALLVTMATCAFILATAIVYYLLIGMAFAVLELASRRRLA